MRGDARQASQFTVMEAADIDDRGRGLVADRARGE
jgi:hypothetical protein